jgi:hypothetical protein
MIKNKVFYVYAENLPDFQADVKEFGSGTLEMYSDLNHFLNDDNRIIKLEIRVVSEGTVQMLPKFVASRPEPDEKKVKNES